MKKFYAFFIFVFLLSGAVLSETTGNINLTEQNLTSPPVTGFFGYTVQYCNTTSDCLGYICFLDYDWVSSGSNAGWCVINDSTISGCYHDELYYTHGSYLCDSTSSRVLCSSRVWDANSTYDCGVNQTCSSGVCSNTETNTTSTSSSTGTSFNYTSSTYHAISITTAIENFVIVQGDSTSKTLTVKNIGNHSLYNITLTFSGISTNWFAVTPIKYNNLTKNYYATFNITFDIPLDAEVSSYAVTSEVYTHNTSAKATKTFIVNVTPSAITVQNIILPQYDEYIALLPTLEENITSIEKLGKDVSELRVLLDVIKNKLAQSEQAINNNDYFTAKILLDDAKGLMDNLYLMEHNIVSEPGQFDFLFIVILVVIIVGVGIFLLFMFMPSKKNYQFHKIVEETNTKKENKILNILKKKKRDKFAFNNKR